MKITTFGTPNFKFSIISLNALISSDVHKSKLFSVEFFDFFVSQMNYSSTGELMNTFLSSVLLRRRM